MVQQVLKRFLNRSQQPARIPKKKKTGGPARPAPRAECRPDAPSTDSRAARSGRRQFQGGFCGAVVGGKYRVVGAGRSPVGAGQLISARAAAN